MRFAVFLPPQALAGANVPALFYLAGLTCTEETFAIKAGAQRFAARAGHGADRAGYQSARRRRAGRERGWDFGVGAGFYVDATQEPWAQALSDVVLRHATNCATVLAANFPWRRERLGIFGHSMGGHGALMLALRNPGDVSQRVGVRADRRAVRNARGA